MGNCLLGESPFQVLRYSLPGSLIANDGDFREFFAICRTETHKLTSQLPITSSMCFFVVVSGEVQITVTNIKEKRAEIVSIALPGETIMFFGVNKNSTIINGCLELGELKISLHFRSSDGLAQVIGTSYDQLNNFMSTRPYLHALHSLFNIELEPLLAEKGFISLQAEELKALAPLFRIRFARGGQVLRYSIRDENCRFLFIAPEENVALIVPPISDNSTGVLLTGSGIAVPSGSDLSDIIHERRQQQAAAGASPYNSYTNRRSYSSVSGTGLKSNEKKSILGHIRAYIGGRSQTYAELEHLQGIPELFTADLRAELTKLYPGAIFGLEQHVVRRSQMGLDSVVSLESSFVGYIEFEALQFMFKLDKRLKRVLQRNFLKGVLDSVRTVVPMLSEMEDKGYVVLSTLINLRYFKKDEEIFAKGSASENSFIVMRGLVKEWEEKEGDEMKPERQAENDAENDEARYLGYGNLFGEVSLVTDSPYFTSTRAIEPSLLVCINRRAFDRIFNNDKAKLAEIRIRLVGMDVELQHILNHPMGNRLLFEFLGHEMATENIAFLNAVARYEDICDRLRRELQKIQMQHQQHQETVRIIRQTSSSLIPAQGVGEGDSAIITITSPPSTSSQVQHQHHIRSHGTESQNNSRSEASDMLLDQHQNDTSEISMLRYSFSYDDNGDNSIGPPPSAARPSLVIDFMENLEKTTNPKRSATHCSECVLSSSNLEIMPDSGESKLTTFSAHEITEAEKMACLAAGVGPTNALAIHHKTSSIGELPTGDHSKQPKHGHSVSHSRHGSAPVTTIDGSYDYSQVYNFETNKQVSSLNANEYSVFVLHQYHKLQKNITELKEVARKVIDKYVRIGSECEINISAACRQSILEHYTNWVKLSAHDSLRQLQQMQTSANSDPHQATSGASQVTANAHSIFDPSLAGKSDTQLPGAEFAWLFKRARQDITQLLQKDAFVRFKQTTDFKNFILAIKPFEQQHQQHQNDADTVYHTSHHAGESSVHSSHSSTHRLSYHRKPPSKQSLVAANSFNSTSAKSSIYYGATVYHPKDGAQTDENDKPTTTTATHHAGTSVSAVIASAFAVLLPTVIDEKDESRQHDDQFANSNNSSHRKQANVQKLAVNSVAPSG